MTILQENIDAVIDQLTYIRYAHAMSDPQPEFAMFIKGMQHVSGLFDDIVGDIK